MPLQSDSYILCRSAVLTLLYNGNVNAMLIEKRGE